MATKFSFEVPIKHLRDFHDDQDFIFTLDHLFDPLININADLYQNYIEKVHAEGLKTVWLDNGYNETMEASDPSDMIYLAHHVRPTKVISPDDPKWPYERILKSYNEMKSKTFTDAQLITVVSDLRMGLNILQDTLCTSLAVSYWVRGDWDLVDLLFLKEKCCSLHFLGYLNPTEIQAVKPNSCDTSMPIKLAMINKSIEEWIHNGCPHINTKDMGEKGSDFFQRTMSDQEIDLAKYNIKILKEMV